MDWDFFNSLKNAPQSKINPYLKEAIDKAFSESIDKKSFQSNVYKYARQKVVLLILHTV